MHRLLDRQIKRFLGNAAETMPDKFNDFIAAINESYKQFDSDRLLTESSLDLMSKELTGRNRTLQQELNDREKAEKALQREKEEHLKLITKLEEAQNQLMQSEKMASIGQLAAGIAHEINNPIGYVSSNLSSLGQHVKQLCGIVDAYESADEYLKNNGELMHLIKIKKQEADFEYIKKDLYDLIRESIEGITRVKQIVQDLKDFSHADRESRWDFADIHAGLNSTLNVVNNEIKYKAEVIKEYGDIPEIECVPSQLNQVFLNILVNAAQAIENSGTITITTKMVDNCVIIEICDTGTGIPDDIQKRIFDPFFTTKPVGSGTGLGLSLSFGIIKKHHGEISVNSELGKGSRFTIRVPVKQPDKQDIDSAPRMKARQ